jgi:hypothetical protein
MKAKRFNSLVAVGTLLLLTGVSLCAVGVIAKPNPSYFASTIFSAGRYLDEAAVLSNAPPFPVIQTAFNTVVSSARLAGSAALYQVDVRAGHEAFSLTVLAPKAETAVRERNSLMMNLGQELNTRGVAIYVSMINEPELRWQPKPRVAVYGPIAGIIVGLIGTAVMLSGFYRRKEDPR